MIETIGFGEYRARKGFGSSFLTRALITPAHAKLGVDPTPAMKMGTFLHDIILRHDKPSNDFETGITEAKIYQRGDALKKAVANMQGAFSALHDHSIARRLLWHHTHDYEKSIFTEINGLPIKIRPDLINYNDNMIIDLKTSYSASVREFQKKVFNEELGYCLQAALYLDAANQVFNGAPIKVFAWVVVEMDQPYGVNVFYANEETIEVGRQRYLRAIDIVKECVANDKWPCYEENIHEISKPGWLKE